MFRIRVRLFSSELLNRECMKTADWIVLALSLLLILTTSVVMSLRLRAPDDYFTAGRRVRRWLLVLFAFGSGTSSDTQSSVMAATWRSGRAIIDARSVNRRF